VESHKLLKTLEGLPTLETGDEGWLLKIQTDDAQVWLQGTVAIVREYKASFDGPKKWFLTQALDLRGLILDPETFEIPGISAASEAVSEESELE
jgi:hypothetical protein